MLCKQEVAGSSPVVSTTRENVAIGRAVVALLLLAKFWAVAVTIRWGPIAARPAAASAFRLCRRSAARLAARAGALHPEDRAARVCRAQWWASRSRTEAAGSGPQAKAGARSHDRSRGRPHCCGLVIGPRLTPGVGSQDRAGGQCDPCEHYDHHLDHVAARPGTARASLGPASPRTDRHDHG